MGDTHAIFIADLPGALVCLSGAVGMAFVARRLRVPRGIAYVAAAVLFLTYFVVREPVAGRIWLRFPLAVHDVLPPMLVLWFGACLATAIALAVRDRVPGVGSAERRQFLKVSTAAVCGVPAAVLGVGVITRKDFVVRELDVAFPALPRDLEGLRLLQLSDVHMGPFFTSTDLARVVDAANGLRADLAFITGDLITTAWDPLDRCIQELARLRTASGIWGCMGNHEAYAEAEAYTKARAARVGIQFLRYEAARVRFGKSSINLVGVDYEPYHSEYLKHVQELVALDSFNVLLSHNPDVFPQAAEEGFDLTLSGHTHGGQINFEILRSNLNVTKFLTPYTKGLYNRVAASLYVNSGLGTIGVPVRVGAPPEISVVRLVRG